MYIQADGVKILANRCEASLEGDYVGIVLESMYDCKIS